MRITALIMIYHSKMTMRCNFKCFYCVGIRAVVAYHLFLFFCTAGYAVRASLL